MPSTLSDTLVSTLDRWFDNTEVVTPSVNFALFDRDGVVYHRGVGEFQRDGRAPGLDTIYRIASMSKSFEMAIVLVLEERGLLALDDRVSEHVTEFSDPVDAFGSVMPVTIRMLMSNSSGLPEDNGWADHELGLSRDDFLTVIASGLTFADRPGAGFQYSNIGFWLLGVIVENVTGLDYESFARQTILEPLGLTSTRFSIGDYSDAEAAEVAHGFGTFDEGATWFDRPFVGTGIGGCAASMFSTVTDIARWSAWLSSAFDPRNTDDAILSRASRRLMQRIHTSAPSPAERPAEQQLEGIGYGLGLYIENDVRFGLIAQHSGGLPGWSSNMRWHLESGLGVVFFANTNGVRPGIQATAMLRALLESRDVPARSIAVLPTTLAAAEALEAAIVTYGDVSGAQTHLSANLFSADLFSSDLLSADLLSTNLLSANLLSDVPAEVRSARLQKALVEIGGLTVSRAPITARLAWAISGAQLTWTIPGVNGELECRLEMTPTVPALMQRLDVEVRVPVTELSSVTRRYRPVV